MQCGELCTSLIEPDPFPRANIKAAIHTIYQVLQVYNQYGEIPNLAQQRRQFTYSMDFTPYIHGIVPSAAAPGEEVQVLGSYQWSRLYLSNNNGDPRDLVRSVSIGPVRYDSQFSATMPWRAHMFVRHASLSGTPAVEMSEQLQIENYVVMTTSGTSIVAHTAPSSTSLPCPERH